MSAATVAMQTLGNLRLPRAYCPIEPTAKQEIFLRHEEDEVFFGGSAGPGKSWGLLMAALQYVDVPGYHALLLRPTLAEFEQPNGLISLSEEWLGGSDAYWHGGERSWTFPSGASLRFGYLSNPNDFGRYKGVAYSFCGWDELTSFSEQLYRGMFRILRQAHGDLDIVPLRMRSASNPGGSGHSWVKSWFVDPKTRAEDVVFVKATIHDNPHLDYDAYLQTLAHMTPIDRQRLIDGDWDVMEEGGKFHREDFRIVEASQVLPAVKTVRYWDLAATAPTASNPDPDYTAGVRYEVDRTGTFTIRDIVHGRWADNEVEQIVRSTAEADGRAVPVYIEQDPGQAGKFQLAHFKRKVLQGFACYSGSTKVAGKSAAKEVRARPVAAAVGNGLVQIVKVGNLLSFLDEASIFPNGDHDDMVDALSGAHNAITGRGGSGRTSTSVPKGRLPNVLDTLRTEVSR